MRGIQAPAGWAVGKAAVIGLNERRTLPGAGRPTGSRMFRQPPPSRAQSVCEPCEVAPIAEFGSAPSLVGVLVRVAIIASERSAHAECRASAQRKFMQDIAWRLRR